MNMRKVLAMMVAMAAVAGCGGDDGDPSGVAGKWTGAGRYDAGVPIESFELNLTQNGNALGGTYSITRPVRGNMSGTISGSISGDELDLVMTPHGWAKGSVDGNSMSLYWYELGFDGVGGGGNVSLSR